MPKLAIDIEARFAQAMDALDQLGRKADQQAKSMQTAFRGVGTVIGAAFSAAGLLAVGRIAESIAVYKQLSEQMGDTAEAVSSLQLASDLSGVSLDEVARASARLTSTLAKGGKEAQDAGLALAAINIKMEDFKRASPVAQMEQVALALAKFEDGAGKTAVAMQLFGRAGAQLLPLFNDLAAAGGTTARLTQEQILAADEYTKSISRLKNEFQLLVQSLTADLIPTFNNVLAKLNDIRKTSLAGFLLTSGEQEKNAGAEIERINTSLEKLKKTREELDPNKGFANKLNDIVFGDVGDLDKQIALLEKQKAYLKSVQAAQALATKVPDERRFQGDPKTALNFSIPPKEPKGSGGAKTPRETEAEKITDWLNKQVQAAEKFNLLEQTAIRILEAKEKANHGITDAIEEQLLAQARASVESEKARKEVEERAEFEAFLSKVLGDQAAKTKDLADAYRDLIDPVSQYWKKIKEIDELQSDGGLTGEEADKARAKVIDQIYALDKTKEKVEELDEFTKQAARNMQSAFADFLFDPFEDGMDGLLKKFSETVRRMLADALAAKLMNALLGDFGKTGEVGGIIGGLFKAGAGYGESGGATEPVSSLGMQADYGSATASTKSVSVSQTIQFNGGGQDASSDQIRRMVKQAALSAVSESRARNGGDLMSVYTMPATDLFMPLTFEIQMRGNVMINQSPMNGTVRTVEIPGDPWIIRMQYGDKDNAEYPELRAFWHRLRGAAHQFRLWNIPNPAPRGTLRGSPILAAGAAEGAYTIVVAGAAGETLLPGDFLGLTLANGTTQLVEVAEATGTGTITCQLVAPLRRSAFSSSAVVWDRPTAIFMLSTAPFIPHSAIASGDFTIEAVEFLS